MSRLLAMIAILAALALAACGDDDDDSATTAPAPAQTAAEQAAADAGDGDATEGKPPRDEPKKAEAPGTEIVVGESQFGPMLFNDKQQAIYLFDKETSPASECYDACAEAWPPVLTEGEPVGGGEVEEKLIGTTERDDGSTQITYGGHPLYYYAHEGPGQVLCHNVAEFGGLWLVVQPGGDAAPA